MSCVAQLTELLIKNCSGKLRYVMRNLMHYAHVKGVYVPPVKLDKL